MKSRIRKANGRIVWSLSNEHASIEAVILGEEDVVRLLDTLKGYEPSDYQWVKNESGQFHYCLTLAVEHHTFCIYNNFDNTKHDYCASINFTQADRPVLIRSLERFVALQNRRSNT